MTKLHLIAASVKGESLRAAWQRTVRALAAERYGAAPAALAIETEPGGKPFLPGCPGFHFSISHTEGLLAVAVSDRPVGVDAEKLRPIRQRLADRFFTARERDYVCDGPDDPQRLLSVWTRKEAYLKYTGTGIRVPLNSFDVLDGSLPVRMDSFVWEDYIISCCLEE